MIEKSLKDILAFLEENNIRYQLINKFDLDTYTFQPASLKKIIPQGIYFFSQQISPEVTQSIHNSVLFVSEELQASTCVQIIVENPQLTHYKISALFKPTAPSSIHTSVIIDEKAIIGKNVHIGPYSVIGACVIEDNVVIKNNVTIEDNVTLKKNVYIDSNSVIGAGGLAWIWDDEGKRVLQPQLGGVLIEEDCIIATDVTIVRGSLSENTKIGQGTVIAHGTKIGHGTQVQENVHMANNVSIAGNAYIGNRAFLGSASVISSNISVPDDCIVGAGAVVTKSFKEPFITLAGIPATIIKTENYTEKPKGAPKPFKK